MPTRTRKRDVEAPSSVPPPAGPAAVDLGPWTPEARIVELAGRLTDPAFLGELEEHPDRIAILRAGLRSSDPAVARIAAFHLNWHELDHREATYATQLMVDAAFDPADEEDFGQLSGLYEMAGAADLGPVLARLATVPADVDGFYDLPSLHKLVRAEHAPAVARLAQSPHEHIRAFAAEDLLPQLAARTDAQDDAIAAAVLGVDPDDVRTRFASVSTGLDPLLRAVLDRLFIQSEQRNEDLACWSWRWLGRQTPVESDVPFLITLDGVVPGGVRDHDMVAWTMRHLGDAESLGFLRGREGFAALGARAYRGDQEALAALTGDAPKAPGALAILMVVAPEVGRDVVERALFGADITARDEMLELVDAAWREGPLATGVTWDRHVLDGIAARTAASRLTTPAKAAIAIAVPGANTRELARSCYASWKSAAGFAAPSDPRLAFLEVADPGAFRRCVAGLARSDAVTARSLGLELLLRVGATDDEDAHLLVEALRAGERPGSLRHLSRSRADEVRAFLREVVQDAGRELLPDRVAALRALATLAGLPDEVQFFEADEETTADADDIAEAAALWPRTSELILAGRPVDALLHVLEERPTRPVPGVHLVRDPAVRAYLERLRSNRSSGLYAWATGELALMGDADARAEMEAVLAAGRYRWTDDAEGEHKLLGRSLDEALPPLLDEIESNCCHAIAVKYGVCEELLGIDIPGQTGVGETHRAYVDRTVEAGQPWVWSVLAGRYVPGAR